MTTLERNVIGEDTPLRLAVAAAVPDGSMTASGLRREAARGRLVIERTAQVVLANHEASAHVATMPLPTLRLRLQRASLAEHEVRHEARGRDQYGDYHVAQPHGFTSSSRIGNVLSE